MSLIPALLCLLLLSRVIGELTEHYPQPAMIGQGIFSILVLMAVVTTFVTPLLLQQSLRRAGCRFLSGRGAGAPGVSANDKSSFYADEKFLLAKQFLSARQILLL